MDDFYTVYFTDDYEPTDSEIRYFEKAIDCEISQGTGDWINVYTKNPNKVKALISLIGDYYIEEISPIL